MNRGKIMRSAMQKATIEALTWADVRQDVMRVNSGLAQVIDSLSPGKKYVVWRARYPFGSQLLANGALQLPTAQGNLVSVNHPDLDSKLRESLAYTPNMPVGVVLRGGLELFCLNKRQVVPWRIMTPGKIFSLWALLQPVGSSSHTGTMWNITSGAIIEMSPAKAGI